MEWTSGREIEEIGYQTLNCIETFGLYIESGYGFLQSFAIGVKWIGEKTKNSSRRAGIFRRDNLGYD
ncbi:unnamed protein product [marine sediment metagenome]|uniref:Uncharacterized protein n=1 Tax=marine sediment metagenome TaxID=412755 RepID=X1S1D7_9ZZZZ